MSDCRILDIGKSTYIETTAEDLAQEFAADKKAARAKYAGNVVMLDGSFVDLRKTKETFDLPILRFDGVANVSGHPLVVWVECGDDVFNQLQRMRLKNGDRVRVLAVFSSFVENEGRVMLRKAKIP